MVTYGKDRHEHSGPWKEIEGVNAGKGRKQQPLIKRRNKAGSQICLQLNRHTNTSHLF